MAVPSESSNSAAGVPVAARMALKASSRACTIDSGGIGPRREDLPVALRRRGPALAPSGRYGLHEQRLPPRGAEVGLHRGERIAFAPVLWDREQLRERPLGFIREAALDFALQPRRRMRPRERSGPDVRLAGRRIPADEDEPGAARKARHRISAVFRWSIGRNHRADNPVDRAVVALPRANGNAPRHYRALPHREVAAALEAIRRVEYIHPSAVLCVEIIALTAVRAGEARGARWEEIDLEAGVWTIPASRMKAAREFCVPLSTGALNVLDRTRAQSPESSLLFPTRTGGPLPRNAPGRVLRRAGVASTMHGFRSSARSWMAESGVPAEVAEACLAHVPRSQVVQAYQRSDLLERRAQVLQAWSDYLT